MKPTSVVKESLFKELRGCNVLLAKLHESVDQAEEQIDHIQRIKNMLIYFSKKEGIKLPDDLMKPAVEPK